MKAPRVTLHRWAVSMPVSVPARVWSVGAVLRVGRWEGYIMVIHRPRHRTDEGIALPLWFHTWLRVGMHSLEGCEQELAD